MAAAADIALLDLDGVLFAHPAAFALVHRRVERFVARHLVVPGRASSTGRAGARVAPVHDALYRRYGHTLLGLRAEHGCTATVRDFNRSVFNPAFDVADNALISGIVTEYGVIRKPFGRNIARVLGGRA